jgi:heat shock protein HtpX
MLLLLISPLALLVEGLMFALVAGIMAVAAPRLLGGEPRSLWGLRLSMLVTALAVTTGSLGVLYLALSYLGMSGLGLNLLLGFIIVFMLAQWLLSPLLINAAYRVRDAEDPWLLVTVERLARETGLSKPPRVVVADTPVPNAFAYGSPITGNYVAVTRGLLRLMPREEVAAVIGHELGHLKHRDVAVILALGLLPTAIYFLGRMMVELSWWTGMGGDRDNDSSPLLLLAVGAGLVAVGIIFHFLVTHFSRLREYYADSNSAKVTGDPRLLQRALARLHLAYSDERLRAELKKSSAFSTLFIVSYLLDAFGSRFYVPGGRVRLSYDIDSLVEELKHEKTSALQELFSTHPPIPKRLRFLDRLRLSREAWT